MITKPDCQLLAQLYQTQTLRQIGEQFSVTAATVSRWLKDCNIATRTSSQAREVSASKSSMFQSNPQAKRLLDDYDWCVDTFVTNLQPIQKICNQLQVAEPVVRKRLKQFDIIQQIQQAKQAKKQSVIDLYQQGQPITAIDQLIDVPISTQQRWLNQANVNIRSSNHYPRKFHRISSYEREIRQWLEQHHIEYTGCDRRFGTEFDIVIDNAKLAIEINGLFYHSEKGGKDRYYHWNKTIVAKQAGLQLWHIFENQYVHNKPIIYSILANKLGLTTNKIYGRQTNIVKINRFEKDDFLNRNHLQATDDSSVYFGLQFQDQLVSVITFRTPRFNNKYQWELVRFASLLNTNVVGGFSKLLKHFEQNYDGSIISYSDNSRYQGNVYKLNGFEFSHINKPSYWYWSGKDLILHPRTKFTKSSLKRLLNTNADLTESQMAEIAGLTRVWDCGTTAWIKKRPA